MPGVEGSTSPLHWDSVTTDTTTQTRSHNAQNQVTAVGGATLTYDGNGNLTRDETGRRLIYDAWNRGVAQTPPGVWVPTGTRGIG